MKICLVGNQNSGKTTLFNALTGMNQKIGNWPGVTIEKKVGIIKGTELELVDLPGIYSLYSYTEEEKVSSNYILKEKPDIIINIVDATCLERSLYLTTQLLQQKSKVIVALNMSDVLQKKGITINTQILQEELHTPVCKISALKQIGIEELIAIILGLENCKTCHKCDKGIKYGNVNSIGSMNYIHNFNQSKKIGLELLQSHNKSENMKEIEQIEKEITTRYDIISKIVKDCSNKKKRWISTTETLDKIFLSKIFAIPIFIFIMFSIYTLSAGIIGKYTNEFMQIIIQKFSDIISIFLININVPDWLQSLILNGIIKGVSAVLSFVPQLAILFTCISLLETTGYMSRIAFLFDSFFKKIGLSGKSLIPFIIGSGCSVPGIISTKILENDDERRMTSILVPFIPCSAKLPIIALFSGYFFRENAAVVSFSLYVFAVLIIILSSVLMRKCVFANINSSFISELPDYKLPNLKYVFREVKEKTSSFIKRAGTTILIASIIIWFLISFRVEPSNINKLIYGVNIENSILATLGKKISWLFVPILGVNSWEATVSAIQGLIAKEQVISSLAIISGMETNSSNIFLHNSTFTFFNKASAYAFLVFNLFSAPCFATIATMKKELGGFKQMFLAIFYQIIIAWILAAFTYTILLRTTCAGL